MNIEQIFGIAKNVQVEIVIYTKKLFQVVNSVHHMGVYNYRKAVRMWTRICEEEDKISFRISENLLSTLVY